MSTFLSGITLSLLFCLVASFLFEHLTLQYLFGIGFLLTLFALILTRTVLEPEMTLNFRFVIVDRDAGEEKLRGKIIHETFFSYVVRFNTFSAGTWEEALPKRSKEILEIW